MSTVETAPEVEIVQGLPGSAEPETRHFDIGKAIRYSVANYGSGVVYTLFNTGISLYLDSYHLNPALIAPLANERSLVGAIVQPVVGRISDRTRTRIGRRRPFFLIGIPLMAVALAFLSIHPPFWLMLGVMTISAFFLAMAVDPYTAMLGDVFLPQERGRVSGFQGLANGLGAVTLVVMALFLWEKQEPLVFALVIVLLVATWTYTFFSVKEPPIPPDDLERQVTTARRGPVGYLKDLLQYNQAARYTLAMSLFWMGNGGATPLVTLFGKHALGASEGETFLLPLAYILVTIICSVPLGYMADKVGKKKIIAAGLLIYGVGAIVGSQSPSLPVAIVALGVIGIGNAACTAQLVALLTEMVPRSRYAELVGVFSAVTSFAQPLGSALAGGVVALATGIVGLGNAYRWGFIVAGVCILAGLALFQTVHPERANYKEAS